MSVVQHVFPFARPLASKVRSVRRPFHPLRVSSPYKLPHDVRDLLAAALAPFRNRDAAFSLAVFLARFWSMPGRVAGSFPIDRRALADHSELVLTEARVRGAIKTLEAIGFLDRLIPAPGSQYKAVGEGLHRKPIFFVFGGDYARLFLAANKRAAAAQGRGSKTVRPMPSEAARRPATSSPVVSAPNSPKGRSEAGKLVLMGEVRKESGLPPLAFEPDPRLEAALENLRRGVFGRAEGASRAIPDRQGAPWNDKTGRA
ncbi:hypothetical protein HPT29_028405 (plasmid) [Microvirga terrae]|uniref:Helix-turn-helix domain-containing protein n=1 Tax=Microvirga terrae TaxID=2740529 RepID=A0ABY5S059_9HYPH|nr:hypothetical protein [Microvirga terrae]UVF22876.1 hypothetical protein HPT29_028405 [Microvirga terrae]